MKTPWECSVCHERFTSLFKGSIHARNHMGAPPAVIVYTTDWTPVSRSLDPDLDAWGGEPVMGGERWDGE
jgi:hypothetical protein